MKITRYILRMIAVFIFLYFYLSSLFGQISNEPVTIEQKYQSLIDSVVIHNDSVLGIILHVESPDLKISWTGAAGLYEREANSRLKANQPFRIASITKTYVATAILRLYESNKLSLNDTIGKYLSKTYLNILRKDSYITDKITIKHLLNHSGGIYDYAMTDLYFKKIAENPKHWWSLMEQMEIAIQEGSPQGNPGEGFYYTDTGYILLGEIIETITGKSLAESLRELIGFEHLGLNSTWLESFEGKPEGVSEIVHPYYNGVDYYNTSPSIDLYGGGGLVSTASDVAVFFQLLFGNKVFKKTSTLDTMLTKTIFPIGYKPIQDYRLGIQVDEILDFEIYYHTGIWGGIVAYIPDLKASLAINFTGKYDPNVIKESILILKRLKIP